MKKLLLLFAAATFIFSCGNSGAAGGKAVALSNSVDSISYVIGLSMTQNIDKTKQEFGDDVQFNYDAIVNGMQEGFAKKARITDNEVPQIMRKFQQQLFELNQKKREAASKPNPEALAQAQANLVKGQEFLAANGKEEGVITTSSGLQYKVTKEGTGASPKPTDRVKVHYHGTMLDGSVFDSSVDKGEPISFSLQGVIRGWTEGIPTMKVGGKTTFYVPSNLAYGPQGRPGIPGNALLKFDVELLEINPKQ